MTKDGGGWTVLLRRIDGLVNFHRTWQDYKQGFGNLTGELWLGNEHMSSITARKIYQVYFHLEDWERRTRYAKYQEFRVHPESEEYKLYIQSYSGTAGNSMSYHNGMKFSTYDHDNEYEGYECSKGYKAGFWFKKCFKAGLTVPYSNSSKPQGKRRDIGILWTTWHGFHYSLKIVTMKIRPVDFK